MTIKELKEKYNGKISVIKIGKNPTNLKKYVLLPIEITDFDDAFKLANTFFKTKKENLQLTEAYSNKKLTKLYLKKPFFTFNKVRILAIDNKKDTIG